METVDVDAILACHEFRCAWEADSYWYVTQEAKTNRRVWERRLSCLRGCGCTRTDRRPPVINSKITSRNYYRSEQWKQVGKIYFTAAGQERLRLQKRRTGIK